MWQLQAQPVAAMWRCSLRDAGGLLSRLVIAQHALICCHSIITSYWLQPKSLHQHALAT